jgi:hypothetical protein
VEDEDRQWSAIASAAPAFVGLPRPEAEELAAGLGLHPCVLDWDVMKDKYVALDFTTRDDIIVLHVEAGVVTRAEPR